MRVVPLLYFCAANAIIIACCVVALKKARRRLQRKRLTWIVIGSLSFTTALWLLIDRMSPPAGPAQGAEFEGP